MLRSKKYLEKRIPGKRVLEERKRKYFFWDSEKLYFLVEYIYTWIADCKCPYG